MFNIRKLIRSKPGKFKIGKAAKAAFVDRDAVALGRQLDQIRTLEGFVGSPLERADDEMWREVAGLVIELSDEGTKLVAAELRELMEQALSEAPQLEAFAPMVLSQFDHLIEQRLA